MFISVFADESSLSDRGSGDATNSVASGFTSGSGGSAGNRKPTPPEPGALPVPIPPSVSSTLSHPKATTTIGGRSPKPPPLVLTTTNLPLTNGSKCAIPQTLNLTTGLHVNGGARTVASRLAPPHNLPLKTDEQIIVSSGGEGESAGESADGGLVFITIIPDEQGRFGFNVKGGVDQKVPIIVSRVGSNTPADR